MQPSARVRAALIEMGLPSALVERAARRFPDEAVEQAVEWCFTDPAPSPEPAGFEFHDPGPTTPPAPSPVVSPPSSPGILPDLQELGYPLSDAVSRRMGRAKSWKSIEGPEEIEDIAVAGQDQAPPLFPRLDDDGARGGLLESQPFRGVVTDQTLPGATPSDWMMDRSRSMLGHSAREHSEKSKYFNNLGSGITHDIDLTTTTPTMDPSPSYYETEDPELAEALKLSMSSQHTASASYTPYRPDLSAGGGFIGPVDPSAPHQTDEDKALNSAIQDSLLDTVGGMGVAPYDARRPSGLGLGTVSFSNPGDHRQGTERVRSGDMPVLLRATSHNLNPLANYLQALYAVKDWRAAFLHFEPSPITSEEKLVDFDGFWRGYGLGLRGGGAGRGSSEEKRILAIRRLFAFMTVTRRSFVAIGPQFATLLGCEDYDFHMSSAWVSKVGELHKRIIEDFAVCDATKIKAQVDAGEIDQETEVALRAESARRFQACGREVTNDEYIGAPLAPRDELESIRNAVAMLTLTIPLESPSSDMYVALDRQLVINEYSASPSEEYALFTSLPPSFTFQIERSTRPRVSAEMWDVTPEQREEELMEVNRQRVLFVLEKEIWLDRYLVNNRKVISEKRAAVRKFREEVHVLEEKKRKLALTETGASAVDLLRATVSYFKEAVSQEPERTASQSQLADQYEEILRVMEEKIAAYDAEISKTSGATASIFETPDMKFSTPYRLTSFLVRNGLNGRINNWAIVKGEDDKWYRSYQMENKEVALETALKDVAGLRMDAGIYLAFYARESNMPEPEVPLHLLDSIQKDNRAFASELPADLTSDWNLPPIETLSLDSDFLSIDDDATDSSSTFATEPEPEHIDLSAIGGDSQTTCSEVEIYLDTDTDDVVPDSQQAPALDTEMIDVEAVPSTNSAVDEVVPAMALRGGALEEEFDDDEDDDEGQNEDEVELGCLVPMTGDWDVDLSVGKVGGAPRWLDPASPLSYDDVACAICGMTMSFLLQMNSPDDDQPLAAARTLYIFACRSSSCQTKDASAAMKIFRTQMASPNVLFPHTTESKLLRTQLESALAAPSKLGGTLGAGETDNRAWKEWNLVCEPEPYEESYLDDGRNDVATGPAEEDGEDATAPDTATGVDTPFLVFQERLSRLPEQVLRFYRLPEIELPQPLWVSSDRVVLSQIPLCSLCGGTREIEFQVLSTLLTHLGDESLSFDSLLLYTCRASCAIPARESKTGWTEEVLVVQSFEAGGVKFGRA